MASSKEQERFDRRATVATLPIRSLPKDIQKPVSSFQRQALVMRKLPDIITAREQTLMPFLEPQPDETGQEFLTRLLFDPDAKGPIVQYFSTGAEIDIAVRKLDDTTIEAIHKSTKGRRQMPTIVRETIETMLQVVDAVDFVNPFDSLPPGSPTIQELSRANARTGEFGVEFSAQSQTVQKRIINMFEDTGDTEQIARTAFLVFLAQAEFENADRIGEDQLHNHQISAGTRKDLHDVGELLSWVMISHTGNLVRQVHGHPASEDLEFPKSKSLFPVALASFALHVNIMQDTLPTTFETLIDNGLIPGLERNVAQKFKDTYTENFRDTRTDTLQRSDENGVRPYELLLDRFDQEKSLTWLNEIAPYYPMPPDTRQDAWEFLLEHRRIAEFLKERVVLVGSDEHIASIYTGATQSGIDIILLSHDQRALGIQIGNFGLFSLQIDGIPGGYEREAEGFVDNIFSQVLTHLRNQGYLDTPYKNRFTGLDTYRSDFEKELRARTANKQDASVQEGYTSVDIRFANKTEAPTEEETVFEQRTKRFTITVDEHVIKKAGLSELENDALIREIRAIEYSEPGTYPMRKLEGYKGDLRRLAVKTLATTPNGKKVRVNLRAAVEFNGTIGTVVRIGNRQGIYNELEELFK